MESTCPSCNKPNEGDSSFCIYCGSSIKPGSMSGRKPTIAGSNCLACGRSDELNAKYCVFCGAAITQLTIPADEIVQPASSNATGISGLVTGNTRKSGSVAAFVKIAAGIILGLACGAGLAFGYHSWQNNQPPIPFGLAITSQKPHMDVLIANADNRNFVIGRTGGDGNFAFKDLRAGQYEVFLDNAGSGKTVTVDNDVPTIIQHR